MARFLPEVLKKIEAMPENTFKEITNKYVEMNVAPSLYEEEMAEARASGWTDPEKKSKDVCGLEPYQ